MTVGVDPEVVENAIEAREFPRMLSTFISFFGVFFSGELLSKEGRIGLSARLTE